MLRQNSDAAAGMQHMAAQGWANVAATQQRLIRIEVIVTVGYLPSGKRGWEYVTLKGLSHEILTLFLLECINLGLKVTASSFSI
jgi:hypothetical protein